MYFGGGVAQTVKNPQNVPVPFNFVTAYLRGSTDGFTLKGGDATQGTLTTMYDGPRPFVTSNGTNTQGRKYQPAKKRSWREATLPPAASPPLHSPSLRHTHTRP